MARTLTRASQIYPAGSYGPFSLDSFTKNDTDRIELELTVESWPATGALATITITTDSGAGMTVEVPNAPLDIDGNPVSVFAPWLGIPIDTISGVTGKRDTSGASVSVVVHQAFRTALTARAA